MHAGTRHDGLSDDAFGFRVVHHSVPRKDAHPKVTGQAVYTADVLVANMAFAKLVRSRVVHARIRSIDTSAAMARPGVVAVVTGADLAKLHSPSYGHTIGGGCAGQAARPPGSDPCEHRRVR
jgi:CO/xanthine dehydrogenase Mo-binding subunit